MLAGGADDEGQPIEFPFDISEVTLCERFGWTFTELDNEDMARVIPSVTLANIRAALGRVELFLQTAGGYQPTEDDLIIYQMALEADRSNGG